MTKDVGATLFASTPLDSVWQHRRYHYRYQVVAHHELTLLLRVVRADGPAWYPDPKPFFYSPVDLIRDFQRVP